MLATSRSRAPTASAQVNSLCSPARRRRRVSTSRGFTPMILSGLIARRGHPRLVKPGGPPWPRVRCAREGSSMPPHGPERPTRSGSPPRAGFAMRQPPAPDPAGRPDGSPNGGRPNGQGPDGGARNGNVQNGRGPLRPVPAGSGQAGPGQRPDSATRNDLGFDGRSEGQVPPRPRPGSGPGVRPDTDARPVPRPAPPPAPAASARIEQLLVAAQRQIVGHAKAAAAESAREAAEIRAAAESYAAGLRASAEFENASVRAEAEREAAKVKAAAERERDDIVKAARREADDIRRREQFLLEQSETLRSQAEADLEVELADRRAEAERLEVERLADAQEATRKLVEEAERR